MKFRVLLVAIVTAGLLSGMPAVHADEHHGMGDYDQHHEWHDADWWREHEPGWVRKHHPDWFEGGDWDKDHHWHDKSWWKVHDPKWAHEHHHDWW